MPFDVLCTSPDEGNYFAIALKRRGKQMHQAESDALGETTAVRVRLGLLMAILGTLATGIIWVFLSLRTDVLLMLVQVSAQQHTVEAQQKQIVDILIKQQSLEDALKLACPPARAVIESVR